MDSPVNAELYMSPGALIHPKVTDGGKTEENAAKVEMHDETAWDMSCPVSADLYWIRAHQAERKRRLRGSVPGGRMPYAGRKAK
jgi:hypothetical protein